MLTSLLTPSLAGKEFGGQLLGLESYQGSHICSATISTSTPLILLLCFGTEFTTMAGRRLRDSVKNALISGSNGEFNNNIHVVLAGLTNTYSQYVTTFEEYQIQRYEVCPSTTKYKVKLHMIFVVICCNVYYVSRFHFIN